MEVTLTQHPVGQGGMMSGRLSVPGGRFLWIYDCGSNQTAALEREIDSITQESHVDCLFLSHLDSDHVNGVDRLLSRVPVREVVLPYLENLDRWVAAAHDIATGTSTGTFLTFLSDAEGWFGERGVERVTYITPRSDDDEGDEGPASPEPSDGDGEGQLHAKWSHPGKDIAQSKSPIGRPIARTMPLGAYQRLQDSFRTLDWVLVPYAHRPSKRALEAFEEELKSQFGDPLDTAHLLATVLKNASRRDALRDCYDLIWSDHNLVSMALYAGPLRSERWKDHYVTSMHGYRLRYGMHHPQCVGWLGTGDMHLNVARRRKAFLAHYRQLLDQVNVFGLPHHGSDRNFDTSLPTALPHATQFVAATGPNSYGHPGERTRRAVTANGKAFVRVSDRPRSCLEWWHRSR
jgi:hypothetical protein